MAATKKAILRKRPPRIMRERLVPKTKYDAAVARMELRCQKGELYRVSDLDMTTSGLAVYVRIENGRPYFTMITRRGRVLKHERDHADALVWFFVNRLPAPRSRGWLGLWVEMMLPTQMRPFEKREVRPFDNIRQLVRSGRMTDGVQLKVLHDALSKFYPTASAYRNAVVRMLQAPAMRAHLRAMDQVDYGTSTVSNYTHVQRIIPHALAVVDFIERDQSRFRRKAPTASVQ